MTVDKGIRILLIEDDDINRKLLANILKTIGFSNISEAADGIAGWSQLQEQEFDLVLTDWMMPELDGLELLMKIRKSNETFKDLPILMITAMGKQEDVMKAMKWGINGYIVKPYNVTTILAKIEVAMNTPG
jgi:two-component system, chemotaxis family, chemotaxis protein CheY